MPLVAGGQQTFHRDVTQTARRDIGDAQQADVVVRVDERLQVSQEILDLAPVKIALAAHDMVANARLAQGGFQRARLLVGAEKNGLIPPGHALRETGKLDDFRRAPRLLLVGTEGMQRDAGPLALV